MKVTKDTNSNIKGAEKKSTQKDLKSKETPRGRV
jgi:hypothetical protein